MHALLREILADFRFLLPELWLGAAFLGLLAADIFLLKKSYKYDFHAALFLVFLVTGGLLYTTEIPGEIFQKSLVSDNLSTLFKGLALLAAAVATGHSWLTKRAYAGEFFVVLVGMLLGIFLMTMSANLLMLYLSVEVVSVSSYILTAFRRDSPASEASVKYLLFGAVASALALYGMSLLYGLTGTLLFTDLAFGRELHSADGLTLAVAIALTVGGLFFKLAAVPFHFWVADVYQVTAPPVVSFFSVAPKVVALLVLVRLLAALPADFRLWLGVAALLSVGVGNFSAIAQKNPWRLMAFSSIAQSGFMLMGLVAFTQLGVQASLFYGLTYLFATMGVFYLMDIMGEIKTLDDLAGRGLQQPLWGVCLTFCVVSLIGLPLTVGFTAKLLVFSALWEIYQQTNQSFFVILLIFGVLNTAIGLVYYLRIPFVVFFREASDTAFAPTKPQLFFGFCLTLPVIVLFLKTDWLLDLLTGF